MTNHKGISVAAVILDEIGQVLLVKQTYGHLNWELPGGGVEDQELLVDAVVREVCEEAGLTVVPKGVTGLYDEDDENFLHVVFSCQVTDPSKEPAADLDEVSVCAYWPPDALPRPISEYTVRRIADALQNSGGSLPAVIRKRGWLQDESRGGRIVRLSSSDRGSGSFGNGPGSDDRRGDNMIESRQ